MAAVTRICYTFSNDLESFWNPVISHRLVVKQFFVRFKGARLHSKETPTTVLTERPRLEPQMVGLG